MLSCRTKNYITIIHRNYVFTHKGMIEQKNLSMKLLLRLVGSKLKQTDFQINVVAESFGKAYNFCRTLVTLFHRMRYFNLTIQLICERLPNLDKLQICQEIMALSHWVLLKQYRNRISKLVAYRKAKVM